MRTINVRAVIITDGESYFIHGIHQASEKDPSTAASMFKAMHPLWSVDPSIETIHYVEIPIQLPELEDMTSGIPNTE